MPKGKETELEMRSEPKTLDTPSYTSGLPTLNDLLCTGKQIIIWQRKKVDNYSNLPLIETVAWDNFSQVAQPLDKCRTQRLVSQLYFQFKQ